LEAPVHITLIPFGNFETEMLVEVANAVTYEFHYPVKIKVAHLDLSEYFDAGRRQYHGNNLLELMEALVLPDSVKTIGLFNVDLFIPILTYIFGQAALGGNKGIVSVYRLNNQLYGMPANKDLLLQRFIKEVIHELGHTFGLLHCHTPECVMRSSTYVEDIDLKDVHLCETCRKFINADRSV
jgi:archaemetzincin